MRMNIEIDDDLMREAMRCTGARTKKAAVEAALRLLIQTRSQAGMRRLRGKVRWEGYRNVSRLGRIFSGSTSKGISKASPLDVKGIKSGVSTTDLVAIVRKGRERG